jgi:hypothetical protein
VRDREVIVERDREADEPLTADRDATTSSTDRTTDRETVK